MQIDFRKLRASYQENADNQTRIGYFSLKNDGDTALVRFAHASPDDFDVVFSHEIEMEGRRRKINCLRGKGDPANVCPFCREEVKGALRIYIHLIEYTKDAQGNVVATPKIWERPISYGDTLADYADEYSPLSDYMFKIKRNGVRGSQNTTYTITPCNASTYNMDEYPPHPEFFADYRALGRVVLQKTPEEMETILQTMEEADSAVENTVARTYTPMTGSVRVQAPPAVEHIATTEFGAEAMPSIQASPAQPIVTNTVVQRPAPIQQENQAQPANNPFARPRRFYQN